MDILDGGKVVITSVDTASEALAVSLAEKACVDLGYMASLMGGGDKIPQIVEVGFPLDIPRPGDFGVVYLDIPLCVIGGVQQLKHELPYHIGVDTAL